MGQVNSVEPRLAERDPRGLTRLRQDNLSRLLRIVHDRGEASRSELAEALGVTRSSVMTLVSELERQRLVEQSVGSATGDVGRPSSVVRPSDSVVAFALIPSYESVLTATVGFSGKVRHRSTQLLDRIPSPEEFVASAAEQIREHLAQLDPGTQVAGIGVAIPGHVRVNEGIVHSAYSLAWDDVALGDMLQRATSLPVWLDNDGSLASLAEHRFGVGVDTDNMVLLHGAASGVGGGVIVGGATVRGRDGYAGELGHMPVSDERSDDYLGIPGSVDQMVNRIDLLTALGLSRADDAELEAAVLSIAPDSAADQLIAHQAKYLGRAIGLLTSVFNPELVVLTGFLRTVFDARKELVLDAFASNSLDRLRAGCEVVGAALGDELVFIGAAQLPLSALIDDPLGFPLLQIT